MHKSFYTFTSCMTLLSLVGGLVWAAQLDGLQLKPDDGKLQVILDVDQEQTYHMEQDTGSGYRLVLPKAKLPAAFQGTGVPAVTSPETGIRAEIQETSDGLNIHLKSTTGKPPAIEVSFKAPAQPPIPQPKSPLALLKPEKQEIKELFEQLKQGMAPKPQTKALYMGKQAVQVTGPAQPGPHVPKAVKPQPPQAPPKITAQKPPVTRATVKPPAKDAKPPVTVSKAKPKLAEKPVVTAQKPAQPAAKKPAQVATAPSQPKEAYNFLQQAQEEAQPPAVEEELPPAAEESAEDIAPLEELEPAPYREGQFAQRPETQQSERRGISPSLIQWLLVSFALLGLLLLVMVGLAIFIKRRADSAKPLPLEPPETEEFFEAPEQLARPPETYEEALEEEAPQIIQPRPQVIPPPVTPQAKPQARFATRPAVPAAQEKPVAQQPARLTPEQLLAPPATTVQEAVRSSLGSKSSRYMSAPFRIAPKPVTQGSPRPKAPASPQATPQANRPFNRLLSNSQ